MTHKYTQFTNYDDFYAAAGEPKAGTQMNDEPLIIKFRMFAIWASVVMIGFTVVCFVYATTTDLYSTHAVTDILLGILSLEMARVMLAVTYRAHQLWGELSDE